MEKNLDYLFNDVPLYTKEEFKIFELKDDKCYINKEELQRFNIYIGFNKDRIVAQCHKCKMDFPFEVKKRFFNDIRDNISLLILTDVKDSVASARYYCEKGSIDGLRTPFPREYLLNNRIWYGEYRFKCTNDSNHLYFLWISIELKDGMFIVRKIGQNPSMLSIKGFDFSKYEKILNRFNAFEDYKKADLSNAEQFYVGAYAYLRRIFEKMINYYLKEKGINIPEGSMEDKIDSVKEQFDTRVRKLMKNIYGILSKSIHELDEKVSKEYYEKLKAVIDMQLEYIYTEEEKEKQSKDLESVISKITNSVKKK